MKYITRVQLLSVEREEALVQVRPPVPEQAPARPLLRDDIQVKGMLHIVVLTNIFWQISLSHNFPRLVADERPAVEFDFCFHCLIGGVRRGFHAVPVRRDHRNHVRRCVPLHHSPPVLPGLKFGVLRLAPDRSWIKEQLRSLQRHAARRLRKPLVPTNADADASVLGLEHLETRVPRREEKLFLVPRRHGDVALSVDPELLTSRVDDTDRIEERLPRPLKEADGKHDFELLRYYGHLLEQFAGLVFFREIEVPLVHLTRKVLAAEELRQQHYVSMLCRCI
mmetsp:Transcript_3880/g.9786  ORF Transcript_3880/g.9786 Transcript_3880/m.9786 type:complete len:280 (-) Transcript_3880:294-1133(-)